MLKHTELELNAFHWPLKHLCLFVRKTPGNLTCILLRAFHPILHNNVLFVKIEGLFWYTIYHHLPVVKGVSSNPCFFINQPMGIWDIYDSTWVVLSGQPWAMPLAFAKHFDLKVFLRQLLLHTEHVYTCLKSSGSNLTKGETFQSFQIWI
jgi:hypothetical protein